MAVCTCMCWTIKYKLFCSFGMMCFGSLITWISVAEFTLCLLISPTLVCIYLYNLSHICLPHSFLDPPQYLSHPPQYIPHTSLSSVYIIHCTFPGFHTEGVGTLGFQRECSPPLEFTRINQLLGQKQLTTSRDMHDTCSNCTCTYTHVRTVYTCTYMILYTCNKNELLAGTCTYILQAVMQGGLYSNLEMAMSWERKDWTGLRFTWSTSTDTRKSELSVWCVFSNHVVQVYVQCTCIYTFLIYTAACEGNHLQH